MLPSTIYEAASSEMPCVHCLRSARNMAIMLSGERHFALFLRLQTYSAPKHVSYFLQNQTLRRNGCRHFYLQSTEKILISCCLPIYDRSLMSFLSVICCPR